MVEKTLAATGNNGIYRLAATRHDLTAAGADDGSYAQAALIHKQSAHLIYMGILNHAARFGYLAAILLNDGIPRRAVHILACIVRLACSNARKGRALRQTAEIDPLRASSVHLGVGIGSSGENDHLPGGVHLGAVRNATTGNPLTAAGKNGRSAGHAALVHDLRAAGGNDGILGFTAGRNKLQAAFVDGGANGQPSTIAGHRAANNKFGFVVVEKYLTAAGDNGIHRLAARRHYFAAAGINNGAFCSTIRPDVYLAALIYAGMQSQTARTDYLASIFLQDSAYCRSAAQTLAGIVRSIHSIFRSHAGSYDSLRQSTRGNVLIARFLNDSTRSHTASENMLNTTGNYIGINSDAAASNEHQAAIHSRIRSYASVFDDLTAATLHNSTRSRPGDSADDVPRTVENFFPCHELLAAGTDHGAYGGAAVNVQFACAFYVGAFRSVASVHIEGAAFHMYGRCLVIHDGEGVPVSLLVVIRTAKDSGTGRSSKACACVQVEAADHASRHPYAAVRTHGNGRSLAYDLDIAGPHFHVRGRAAGKHVYVPSGIHSCPYHRSAEDQDRPAEGCRSINDIAAINMHQAAGIDVAVVNVTFASGEDSAGCRAAGNIHIAAKHSGAFGHAALVHDLRAAGGNDGIERTAFNSMHAAAMQDGTYSGAACRNMLVAAGGYDCAISLAALAQLFAAAGAHHST